MSVPLVKVHEVSDSNVFDNDPHFNTQHQYDIRGRTRPTNDIGVET